MHEVWQPCTGGAGAGGSALCTSHTSISLRCSSISVRVPCIVAEERQERERLTWL